MIKKKNLKETEFFIENGKNIEKDIIELEKEITKEKTLPFQNIFIYFPKEIEQKYLFNFLNKIKCKNVVSKDKLLIIEMQ